ncbi:TrmH family RNA methyltransferase [Aquihabitans sp. McL0605]|uniref:TrmH family RNA methyltransferase n=1 Tax=Aquihabitans sp. McL0605 TaxID=3415671 RepID=UPI003CF4B462
MHRVTEPTDPLLADFTALNDPARRRRVERDGGYFVVEGVLAIERLLALPQWQVRSLALLPKVADRLADQLDALDAPVAVADEAVLREVVGFDIHRGALASVERRPFPSLSELVNTGSPQLLVVAEGVNDHENLGALYRNAAAFGVAAVLLDDGCADPFYRRSVRVSLGNVLAVPTGRSRRLADLHEQGVTTVALTPRGDRRLADLGADVLGPGPLAVVVGAEGPGLSDETIAAAHHRVAIPMATGVDSLNVATAAAVALHHLATVAAR